MFILLFVILEIVKHNVHHFPGVAEAALIVSLILGIIELLWYLFLILGVALGLRKAFKK